MPASYRGPASRWAMLNGYDILALAGFVKEMDPFGFEQVLEETTGPASTRPTFAGTDFILDTPLALTMFYETNGEALFEAFRQAQIDSATVHGSACWGAGGALLGDECNLAQVLLKDFKMGTPNRETTKAVASLTATKGVWAGRIVAPLAARAGATWNTQSTSLDNTASSANGGVAVHQVNALTLDGYTSFTETLKHSADNITFAALVTFTTVTAAPAHEVPAHVTGTVNRYLATSGAYVGAGTSPTVTLLTGFARK